MMRNLFSRVSCLSEDEVWSCRSSIPVGLLPTTTPCVVDCGVASLAQLAANRPKSICPAPSLHNINQGKYATSKLILPRELKLVTLLAAHQHFLLNFRQIMTEPTSPKTPQKASKRKRTSYEKGEPKENPCDRCVKEQLKNFDNDKWKETCCNQASTFDNDKRSSTSLTNFS